MSAKMQIVGDLKPSPESTSFIKMLMRDDGATLRMLDAAARDAGSAKEIRGAVSSHFVVSVSLGLYPGQDSKGAPIALKPGNSFEDAYGFGDGRKVILDGNHITPALAEEMAKVEGRPFVYFDHILSDQFAFNARGDLVFMPTGLGVIDGQSVKVTGNLPWSSGHTTALAPILGEGKNWVWLYGDPKANRLGLLARGFYEPCTFTGIAASGSPSEDKFGFVANGADMPIRS